VMYLLDTKKRGRWVQTCHAKIQEIMHRSGTLRVSDKSIEDGANLKKNCYSVDGAADLC
jgi:hypothetical protein